jgi:hypothetical protein
MAGPAHTAAKKGFENRLESRRDVPVAEVHTETTGALIRERALVAHFGSCLPIRAVLVIKLALFFIAKDIVGFGYLFEFFLGLFIAGIYIWVVLSSQFSIGGLNCLLIGFFVFA